MIGTTISHYKILEKLGEGGMGIVYRAHDTTLDRDVALKFLPQDLTTSHEERTRFIHEAKAVSALDHANICTIHEVGETPDGRLFIAMGYYEGESLAKKIQKGRLRVEDAADIAIQIAEGLQAAHENGIIHRDIKSGNIIVTDKGQVKILDFGLARRSGFSKLTRTGATVGTAAYMSPEQARGEKLDQRSDLWSLGVVLYEMVTGKLPFRGEHEAAILYSVVNEQPKPIEASISDISPELIHIINRTLEKNPAERYKSAEDMLIDLRRLKKETSSTGFKSTGSGYRKSTIRRKQISIMLVAVIFVIIMIVSVLFFSKESTQINPDWKLRTLQIPLTIHWDVPGISGDGKYIAFSGRDDKGVWGLYVMNAIQGTLRCVTSLSSQAAVDISVDGNLLLYCQANYQTNKANGSVIPFDGGPARKLVDSWQLPRFRPGGQRVGYILGWGSAPSPSGKIELWSVGIAGSDPHREFIDSLNSGSCGFAYSPDDKKVAWIRGLSGNTIQQIIIHDLDTGEERVLTSGKETIIYLDWVRDDKIVYTSDRSGIFNVWVVSAKGGNPIQITKGTHSAQTIKSSADGQRILYSELVGYSTFWNVDIAGKSSRQITFTKENQYWPAFSPDGKEIAFIVGVPSDDPSSFLTKGPMNLFVMKKDGSSRRQLTFGEEVLSEPKWSPDGKKIAYGARNLSEENDSFRTYVVELSNPGSPKYITRGIPDLWIDTLRFHVMVDSTMYVVSINGAQPTKVYEDSTFARFIEGEKYILYKDLHRGKNPSLWWIVAGNKPRDVQQKTARMLPHRPGNIKLSGNGKIFYSLSLSEIWMTSLPDGKNERIPEKVLKLEPYTTLTPSWDGKQVIFVKYAQECKLILIENLFK